MYGGFWWFRLYRLKNTAQSNACKQLGLLSAMVCIGSVAGAVAWGANLQKSTVTFQQLAPGNTRRQ